MLAGGTVPNPGSSEHTFGRFLSRNKIQSSPACLHTFFHFFKVSFLCLSQATGVGAITCLLSKKTLRLHPVDTCSPPRAQGGPTHLSTGRHGKAPQVLAGIDVSALLWLKVQRVVCPSTSYLSSQWIETAINYLLWSLEPMGREEWPKTK